MIEIDRHGQLGALDFFYQKRLTGVGQGNILRQHLALDGDGRFVQCDPPVPREHGGKDILSAPVQFKVGKRLLINQHKFPDIIPVGVRYAWIKRAWSIEHGPRLRIDDGIRSCVDKIPVLRV